MHWTKLESARSQTKREDKVIWLLVKSTIMHIRATKHFHYGLLLSTPKRKKRNKTIYTGKLPTSKKKNEKYFWVFILITTTSMEIKLTNFFGFLKVYQTHKKKARKRLGSDQVESDNSHEHALKLINTECKHE